MERQKIRFGDLSTPLKIVVVGSWIVVGYMALAFLVGIVIGLMGL